MENIFYTKDNEHRKEGVAEDDEESVSKVAEGHSTQHNRRNLVDGSEDEGVEEYPAEVLHPWDWPVNVLEFIVIATVQEMSDIGAEKHHQGAGKHGDSQRVCKRVHNKACDKSDEILQRERQLQRQQKEGQQEEGRRHISKQANMLTYRNLHYQKDDKSYEVGYNVIHL